MKNNFLKMVMILFIILAFSAISPAEDFIIKVQVKLKNVCVEKVKLMCTVSKTKNTANTYEQVIGSHTESVPKTGDGSFEYTKPFAFSARQGRDFREGQAYYCILTGLTKNGWDNFLNIKSTDEYCLYSKDSTFRATAKSVFEKDPNQIQDVQTLVGYLPDLEATGTKLPGTITTPEFHATGERNEQ